MSEAPFNLARNLSSDTTESSVVPRPDARVATNCTDVDALRRKAELLQTVVDSLSDGLAAIDLTGRFIQFNPSGAEILGRGATEGPVENWPTTYGLYRPDQRTPYPHNELPLVRALQGETSRDVEMFHIRPGESEGRWLKVTAAPMRDEQDRVTGGVVLFRDNTATKQTQQALEAERRYLRHLIEWQDRERQLTAYDLHDGLVQLVTGAVLHLEAYRSKHLATSPAADAELTSVLGLLRDALDEARRLIGGLRPPVLDEHGVIGAVEYLVAQHRERSNLAVEFLHDIGTERLPSIVEATVFRITQEALQNVARHAETQRAAVSLRRLEDSLELTIRDWGRGFNIGDRNRRRYGLRGIEERCRLLGGTVRIESAAGQGTIIEARLPIEPAPQEEEGQP